MGRFVRTGILAAVVSVCAFALFLPQARADSASIRSSDNELWGAIGSSFFNYKEPTAAPNLPDSEHGWLPSFAGGISMLAPNEARGLARNLYLALEGSGAIGNANYNGAYFYYPTTPLKGTTSETIWTVDGKIGRGFGLGNSAMLIPYVELGYRYWGRDLGGGQVEDYQNFDTLGGVMLQISPVERLVLSAYGSAGTTFAPQMKTLGSTYDLGDAGMYKIGGKVGFGLTPKLELFTTLDYDHFNYGQSPVVSGAYEPNSHTNDTTWRVGLGYRFR